MSCFFFFFLNETLLTTLLKFHDFLFQTNKKKVIHELDLSKYFHLLPSVLDHAMSLSQFLPQAFYSACSVPGHHVFVDAGSLLLFRT